MLPDRLRLPFRFDPQLLAADLALAEQTQWTDHFVKQNYDGEWSAIALRAPAGETHPIRMIYSDPGASAFADTPLLARTPYFRAVLDGFACPLLSVRLMRLAPGSAIKPHRDGDLDADGGTARLHVPVITNPGVEFTVAGKRVAMAPGECWYLRLSEMHAVVNRGPTARVHLVIDALADGWLRDHLRHAHELWLAT